MLRKLVLAAIVAIACIAATAQTAAAGAQIYSSTDNTKAGAPTVLTLWTQLNGTGNALRQYGAAIAVPKTLRIAFGTYGLNDQMCPGSAVQPITTGITPAAYGFDPSSCPATAEVGTAQMGITTGKLYLVNTTPMPEIGIYFDTNVGGVPYGRGMQIDYQGSNQVLRVNGLRKTITNGLKLIFNNPTRPGGLQPQLWNWTEPDDLSLCKPTSQISGGVYTWPTSGTAATSTAFAPKTIRMNGCGIGFKMTTDPKVANATTAVKFETPLKGAGNDRLQYGASFKTTAALFPKYTNFGSADQMCPGSSVQPLNSGNYPDGMSFDVSPCPATANVGTASLGGATGTIYTVNSMPVPSFGVWFDQGVAAPYGRAISVDWVASVPRLDVFGLPASPSAGLTLDFNNPDRPTLPSKVWAFAQPGTSQCANGIATGTTYTYPPTGSGMEANYPQKSWLTLTGC